MPRLLGWCVLIGLAIPYPAVAADGSQRVLSAQLKRPNIVVRGANLGKVEIWAMPTGTGLGDQHLLFGMAARKSAAGPNEKWVLRLPPCDPKNLYLASDVIAVGFDSTGATVGSKHLQPALGAIELYATLCAK